MTFSFNPTPKPSYKRVKQTRKQNGKVTKEIYEQVVKRDRFKCVRCGKTALDKDKHGFSIKLEVAHVENKSQGGSGDKKNLALLCGPKVNSGTCHNWVDETREGKDWFRWWSKSYLDEQGEYK